MLLINSKVSIFTHCNIYSLEPRQINNYKFCLLFYIFSWATDFIHYILSLFKLLKGTFSKNIDESIFHIHLQNNDFHEFFYWKNNKYLFIRIRCYHKITIYGNNICLWYLIINNFHKIDRIRISFYLYTYRNKKIILNMTEIH